MVPKGLTLSGRVLNAKSLLGWPLGCLDILSNWFRKDPIYEYLSKGSKGQPSLGLRTKYGGKLVPGSRGISAL